jgi:AcrR family transcriptional regulator
MPQVLKEEIRARILESALEEFAAAGSERATMTSIAERAGIGTASIYRYYASKDELFAAVITPVLAQQFDTLLDRRVGALARGSLRGEHVDDTGDEMLQFWIANRLAVVVMLRESYGDRFVVQLVKHTLAGFRAAHDGIRIGTNDRFLLQQIFENTRQLLANVLATYEASDDVRTAIRAFWSYQVAGLRALGDHLAMSSK